MKHLFKKGNTFGVKVGVHSHNFINITGKRFERLRVMNEEPKDKHGFIRWKCYCNPDFGGCGKTKIINGASLLAGHTKSCGCINREVLRNKHKPFTWAFSTFSRTDNKLNRSHMTYEEFLKFTKTDKCHYCGDEITWKERKPQNQKGGYNLDRIDSSKGHTKENCVVSCIVCNRMKSSLNRELFLSKCKQITDWNNRINT